MSAQAAEVFPLQTGKTTPVFVLFDRNEAL